MTMDSDFYKIIRGICDFLEGLFFGFCLVTLFLLLIYLLFRQQQLRAFILHAVLIAKHMAILYFVVYCVSLIVYYNSIAFETFRQRAMGPYAWAYWFMLLRPIVLCLLLQLFWVKRVNHRLRVIFVITFLVMIVSLFSASFMERLAIISAAFHRDSFQENVNLTTDIVILIISSVAENTILFSALALLSWFVFKIKKA